MMTAATTHIAGIGEVVTSSDPRDLLTAGSLGSCLGVAIYDPKRREGAMIHCLLPLSKSDPAKAAARPELYVDTGVTKLLEHFYSRGSKPSDLQIHVAGGSNINDPNNVFDIGRKNYTVLRKLLWKNNLLIHGEHIGGAISRTISMAIQNGEVSVRFSGGTVRLSGGAV